MSESTGTALYPAVYRDILSRTAGDLYIGVVGPVRTGKSTFIQGMMEKLVLPSIPPGPRHDRIVDELPQAGSGRQVTTAQPHFVPGEGAANVVLSGGLPARVRLVDSVGYPVPGAEGTRQGDGPRMVKTPWQEDEMPFEDAARLGTDKVMRDHATLGVVVTTDGSVVDLPRSAYAAAEEQVVKKMRAAGKPFLIVLNSAHPDADETKQLKDTLEKKYSAAVEAMNVQQMRPEDVSALLASALDEFPVTHIHFSLPRWVYALKNDHPLVKALMEAAKSAGAQAHVMRDRESAARVFAQKKDVHSVHTDGADLGNGTISYSVSLRDGLFNEILSEQCGVDITDEKQLLSLLTDLVALKKRFSMMEHALDEAERTGYGLVVPSSAELKLEEPKLTKQGARYGVTLRGVSDALHIIRSPVACEISPVLGEKEQSEQFVDTLKQLYSADRNALFSTNFFGRTLRELMDEAMSRKLFALPLEAQDKVQQALTKMLNEGEGGMICILL